MIAMPAGSFIEVPIGGSITVSLRGGTTTVTSDTTVDSSTAANEADGRVIEGGREVMLMVGGRVGDG